MLSRPRCSENPEFPTCYRPFSRWRFSPGKPANCCQKKVPFPDARPWESRKVLSPQGKATIFPDGHFPEVLPARLFGKSHRRELGNIPRGFSRRNWKVIPGSRVKIINYLRGENSSVALSTSCELSGGECFGSRKLINGFRNRKFQVQLRWLTEDGEKFGKIHLRSAEPGSSLDRKGILRLTCPLTRARLNRSLQLPLIS